MPTVLRHDGYRFYFYSNEGPEPPHVRVESAGRSAKFWLRPVALGRSAGYEARALRVLRGLPDFFGHEGGIAACARAGRSRAGRVADETGPAISMASQSGEAGGSR